MAENITPEHQIVEQVEANIERLASLVEAENVDGTAELAKETEALISSLPSKGRITIGENDPITFAALKKSLRGMAKAAAEAQPKAEPKAEIVKAKAPKEGVVAAKTWDQYEGVQELVTLGAEKVAEGVRMHVKSSELAKEIAKVTFDMWTRIENKDGLPDLKGNSNAAKQASSEMYKLAGEGFAKTYDNADALAKLQRSVQTQRTDVRAEWLRMLDEDTLAAADARALYVGKLDEKPDDMSVSEFVAKDLYDSEAMLKGEGEKNRERYALKVAEAEAAKALTSTENKDKGEDDDSDNDGDSGSGAAEVTPDERVLSVIGKFESDFQRLNPEDFPKLSDDAKVAAREKMEAIYKALKDAITATL